MKKEKRYGSQAEFTHSNPATNRRKNNHLIQLRKLSYLHIKIR